MIRPPMALDHLAVSAASLDEGTAYVEAALGVPVLAGGVHPAMGTHNRLLSLGPGLYLEVIAIDPNASAPGRPRWFDLDTFAGRPHLTNWVARTDDLHAALAAAPGGAGVPMELARGNLRWKMAVPDDGRLPFDGGFPALIEWQGADHPSRNLADTGCRLTALEIVHPKAADLRAALARLAEFPMVSVSEGAECEFCAVIDTPHGRRVLK
ncbi:MAG: VOC family protein [Rhodobacter sp.]|nr:VOC family protein [Rhodobacter sp.]